MRPARISEVITFILKEWLLAKREQLDHLRRLNTLESETSPRVSRDGSLSRYRLLVGGRCTGNAG
jgi:hypothetical protein